MSEHLNEIEEKCYNFLVSYGQDATPHMINSKTGIGDYDKVWRALQTLVAKGLVAKTHWGMYKIKERRGGS